MMKPILGQVDELAKLADHASQQDDRWLFIAVLIALMGFGAVVLRYLVNDRSALGQRLTEITDRHIKTNEELVKVVANNTEALHRNTEALAKAERKL